MKNFVANAGIVSLLAACASGAREDATKSSRAAIVGGTDDVADKATVFVVAAQGSNTGSDCSGVMLGPNLVLTSRICVASLASNAVDCATSNFGAAFDPATLTVIDDDAYTGGTPQTAVNVAQILLPNDAHVCGANLALLVLAKSLSPTPVVPRLDVAPTTGEAFTFIGYGASQPNTGGGLGTRRSLAGASVRCVDASCAGGSIKVGSEVLATGGSCGGDAGGPAIASDGRTFAIVSRGPQDCTTEAILQRLDVWADFIRAGAKTAATAGGYAPPSWATSAAGDAGADGATPSGDAATSGDGATEAGGGGTTSSSSGCGVARDRSRGVAAVSLTLVACVLARRRRRRARAVERFPQ